MHIHKTERLWLTFSVAMMALFLAVITTAAVVDGIVPPSHVQSIDPTKISDTPPFDQPGLRKIGDNQYEAYYVARIFQFQPAELDVPVGAHVTFYATSGDVVHGFEIADTAVNMTLTPGWVSSASHTFNNPGTYLLICNEYCGAGHQTMAAKVVVK